MDEKVKKLKKKIETPKFIFKERHILWNSEKSPQSYEDRKFVRYHFVVADDRFIEEKIEKIISNFQSKSIINYPFEEITENRLEGKFKNTGLNYLLVSYDTEYTPKFLSFEGVSKNVKKDTDLRERKVLSIKDYVQRIYE